MAGEEEAAAEAGAEAGEEPLSRHFRFTGGGRASEEGTGGATGPEEIEEVFEEEWQRAYEAVGRARREAAEAAQAEASAAAEAAASAAASAGGGAAGCGGAAPRGGERLISQELSTLLARRRSRLEVCAQTFESKPEASKADASNLDGVTLDAPPVEEWLQGFTEPEEDRRAEFLSDELKKRGPLPAHCPDAKKAPAAARVSRGARDDPARMRELADDLGKMSEMRKELAAEKAQLCSERNALQAREAELRASEEERERQRKEEEANKNYPRPMWLTKLEGTINVGVVGNSGVGKSLLINRLRGLSPGQAGWAPVGVKETTKEVSMYVFPTMRSVRLWDYPGAGTRMFPRDTYIAKMGLRYLDMVVIVTAGRFTETEIMLMEELRQFSVPHLMVRTKIDIDVWNNREDNCQTEDQTLQIIRADLQKNGKVTNPYLVSLRNPRAYDFQRLLTAIFPCFGSARGSGGSAAGWEDAWAMPVVYSATLSAIQGGWSDGALTYHVQGLQVHVSSQDNGGLTLTLTEHGGKVWFLDQLWIDESSVRRAAATSELRWTPMDITVVKPIVWRWRC